MIDPDLHKINIISETKFSVHEIEEIVKIKKQNNYLKKTFIIMIVVIITINIYKTLSKNYADKDNH